MTKLFCFANIFLQLVKTLVVVKYRNSCACGFSNPQIQNIVLAGSQTRKHIKNIIVPSLGFSVAQTQTPHSKAAITAHPLDLEPTAQ
jgi:hypothetical protein